MLNENTEYFCNTGCIIPDHQRTGENGYPCLVPDQRKSTQVLSISMILAVVFLIDVLYQDKEVHLYSKFSESFYQEQALRGKHKQNTP